MTDVTETLRDYQVSRWRKLAEQRLAHLTDLFDSGRWKHYFAEQEFLEVVRETKALVAAWQRLEPAPEPDVRLPTSPFRPELPVYPVYAAAEPADGGSVPEADVEDEIDAEELDTDEIEALPPEPPIPIWREPDPLSVTDASLAGRSTLLPSPFERH